MASATTNVFRVIEAMNKLIVLLVLLRGFQVPLLERMFQPLANLTHLETLTVCADFLPNDHLFEINELLPLPPSCSLKHLDFRLRQAVPTDWIQDLAKNHPNLETLALGRFVRFNELSTPFPALREILLVIPEVSCCRSNM